MRIRNGLFLTNVFLAMLFSKPKILAEWLVGLLTKLLASQSECVTKYSFELSHVSLILKFLK